MRLVASSVFLAVSALGWSQAGTTLSGQDWARSTVRPAALAKNTDAKTASMRSFAAKYTVHLRFDDDRGFNGGDVKVKDAKTFALDYETIRYKLGRRDIPMNKVFVTANGKLVYEVVPKQTPRRIPVGSFKFVQSRTPSDWVLGIPREMLGGFRRETPLTKLVQQASKGGYTTFVDQRTLTYEGRRVPQYRLVVVRTPAAASKLGPLRIEVVIDQTRSLPVSATTTAMEKGKAKIELRWVFNWNLRPQSFPASTFQIPAK